MYCMRHIQSPVYYRKFRHIHVLFRNIQPYCGVFRTLCNSCIFKILVYLGPQIYSELYQVYSGVFRTLCNAGILRTVPYSKFCRIQNFRIFKTLFRHIGFFIRKPFVCLSLNFLKIVLEIRLRFS